jgi:hypothetical protein
MAERRDEESCRRRKKTQSQHMLSTKSITALTHRVAQERYVQERDDLGRGLNRSNSNAATKQTSYRRP